MGAAIRFAWLRILVGVLFWLVWIPIRILSVLLGLVVVPVCLRGFGPRTDTWPRILRLWGNDDEKGATWWREKSAEIQPAWPNDAFVGLAGLSLGMAEVPLWHVLAWCGFLFVLLYAVVLELLRLAGRSIVALTQEARRRFPNFWWLAIRNPVANSRYIFRDRTPNLIGTWAQMDMEPGKIVFDNFVRGIEVPRRVYRIAFAGPFLGIRAVWIHDWEMWARTPAGSPTGIYSEIWFGWKVGSDGPGMGFSMQVRIRRPFGWD